MNISSFSVKRPVMTAMLVLIVILFGIVSLPRLPIDLYPDIEVPVAIISTNYSNVAPEEIENLITKPIEQSVGTVSGIDTLQSITSEGRSLVIIQFDFGIDMDSALTDVREKVSLVEGFLPDDATKPMVFKIDVNAQAIVQLSMAGGDAASLKKYSEEIIEPALERINGVASVSTNGGYSDYVSIEIDTEKLNGYGLNVNTLSQLLAADNINLPNGDIKKGDKSVIIRTVGEYESVEEIANTVVTTPKGARLRLSDIATVRMAHKDLESITNVNGENAVSIAIQKQSGSNTVEVANKIINTIEKLEKSSPYEIKVVYNSAKYINRSISSVARTALQGGLLAILVLLLFLRNFRTTLIIGVSMPISIVATGVLLYFNGITINMMTLGGLTLGIGMLVDNSVVVLENIYRFVQEGKDKKTAAIEGAKEVIAPVIASTLTTIAVFLPMVFVEGITSIMFREFCLTITFALVSSLIVSITLVPMLSSKLIVLSKTFHEHHECKVFCLGKVMDRFDKIFTAVEKGYSRILKKALKFRKTTVLVGFSVFFISIILVSMVGAEFMPQSDEGTFTIQTELETGSSIEETNEKMQEVVKKLEDLEGLDYIFTSTAGGGFISTGNNSGTITVVMKPLSERDISVFDAIDIAEQKIKGVTGIKTTIASQSTMGNMTGGADISITIKGDDLEELRVLGEQIENEVQKVEGTRNVVSSMDDPISQYRIQIDKDAASRYGLTTYQISNAVSNIINGKKATKYKLDGDEYDVIIEGDERYSESAENLKQLMIASPTGALIPLELVADIENGTSPESITRENQVRYITVTGGISGRDLGSVSKDIETNLSELKIPNGYSYKLGGANEEMIESFKSLGLALVIAVLLVYMIIAGQFESLIMPFIIMMSVPLSFSGGFIGLYITNRTLNINSIIGFIMLTGIVVNNAIVLIDYINTRRGFGEDRYTAIIKAGPTRLRPILMTTLTTVLGLLPMAIGIGEGSEMMAPMATTVIGGLLLSTMLTLVFIPVLYSFVDDIHTKFKNSRDLSKAKKEEKRELHHQKFIERELEKEAKIAKSKK